MGDYPLQPQDKYVLRFPDGMRDRLKKEAADNGRSLNAEIIYRLQTTLEMDDYQPVENIHTDAAADQQAERDRSARELGFLIQKVLDNDKARAWLTELFEQERRDDAEADRSDD